MKGERREEGWVRVESVRVTNRKVHNCTCIVYTLRVVHVSVSFC